MIKELTMFVLGVVCFCFAQYLLDIDPNRTGWGNFIIGNLFFFCGFFLLTYKE